MISLLTLLFSVLPEDFEPTSFLKITYGDKLVNAGEELLPEEVVDMPHIWFPAPHMDRHYTIVMVMQRIG